MNQKRDLKIDVLKTLAIILVVVGHAIEYKGGPDFDHNLLFRIIYSFHMPLFMFLSGYLAFGREIDIKKKFLTLAVPFLVWFGISIMIDVFLGKQSLNLVSRIVALIQFPDNGLWFLWILFLNFIVLKLSLFLGAKFQDSGLIATLLAIYFIIQIIPVPILGIAGIKWHFFFFALGFLFLKYRDLINIKQKKIFSVLCVILFPLFVSMWFRFYPPVFLQYLNGFPQIQESLLNTYRLLTPILGIGFVWALDPEIDTRILKVFSKLGLITLDIYVLHQFFLFGNNIWLAAAVSLTISVLLSFILSRFKIIRAILFGRYK